MDPTPLVSIVTPSLNRADLIESTLRSVRSQSYPHVEHIVVDGGSTDGTLAVLRRYEGTYGLRWISEPDHGMYSAINKGLAMARGQVLAYLNSDDLYFPWTVETVVAAFRSHPEADLVHGDVWWVVMRDVSASLWPEGARLTRDEHRRILAAANLMWDEFWGEQVPHLCSLHDCFRLFSPATSKAEAAGVDLLPKQYEPFWEAFAEAVDDDVGEAVLALVEEVRVRQDRERPVPQQGRGGADELQRALRHGGASTPCRSINAGLGAYGRRHVVRRSRRGRRE